MEDLSHPFLLPSLPPSDFEINLKEKKKERRGKEKRGKESRGEQRGEEVRGGKGRRGEGRGEERREKLKAKIPSQTVNCEDLTF